jgi:phosphohistidine swiveling domain-containing protein
MAAPPVYPYKGASKRRNNRERQNSEELERLGNLKPRELGNYELRKCGESSAAPVNFNTIKFQWRRGVARFSLRIKGKPFAVLFDPSQPVGKRIQDDQTTRGLVTAGTGLGLYGIAAFWAGTGAFHIMGPLLSSIGLILAFQGWTWGVGPRWLFNRPRVLGQESVLLQEGTNDNRDGIRPILSLTSQGSPAKTRPGHAQNKAPPSIKETDQAEYVRRFGGKALGLMLLEKVPGIRVPPWGVLPVEVFDEFINDNPAIKEMITQLSLVKNERERKSLLADIRLAIRETPVSRSIDKKIGAIYRDVASRSNRRRPRVSVRSSSPAEDQTGASFAGQYKSFLHINGKRAVVNSVKNVWASVFSEGAVRYRLEQYPDQVWAPMAVIIQDMVDARAAGTAFTVDLETGAPYYSINSTLGAGENEVAGKVTSDRYIVDPNTFEIVKRRLGNKDEKILPPKKGETKPNTKPTSQKERLTFALDHSTVKEIAQSLRAISEHFGDPAVQATWDIEYAVDKSGTLYILQCRPETVWSKKPPKRRTVAPGWAQNTQALSLGGLTATPGVGSGHLRVISMVGEEGVRQAENVVMEGDILVVKHTTNIWENVMAKAGTVITDTGGPGSHTAVIARESQKPAVVGTQSAVNDLMPFNGQVATLDATTKTLYLGEVPLSQIIEAPMGTPTYGDLDHQTEDESWGEVVQSGTMIDRGDGERWIGKPTYALTPFMKEIYFNGHRAMAKRLNVPTRLDFHGDIHVLNYSDLFKWRQTLRDTSLDGLEKISQARLKTTQIYLQKSESFKPTAKSFREWVAAFTDINSFISLGYAFYQVTEGLMERALADKQIVEPYFSQVRSATGGLIGETEATQFLRIYRDLLSQTKENPSLLSDLNTALHENTWIQFETDHPQFYNIFASGAYTYKIARRTEPTVSLEEPLVALAQRLVHDAEQGRKILIPSQESEEFYPEDARFVRTIRLALEAEKAREDSHHLKMRGLWLFRKNMQPFTQWLITKGEIQHYEDIFNHPVLWIENHLKSFEKENRPLSLDSLFSRLFVRMERSATSQEVARKWKMGRLLNDFVAAPFYETAFFFLLPASTGSFLLLGMGLLAFVVLHFYNDYGEWLGSGLSPPEAFRAASRSLMVRFFRSAIFYAGPFALLLAVPYLSLPFALSGASYLSLTLIVAMLHSRKNFLKTQLNIEASLLGNIVMGNSGSQARTLLKKSPSLGKIFPETNSLHLENFSSPGLNHLDSVSIQRDRTSFDRYYKKYISDSFQNENIRTATLTIDQILGRLMASCEKNPLFYFPQNRTPVQIEVCTLEDIPVVTNTINLINTINSTNKKKVYLLLAGVDQETVTELMSIANGSVHIGVVPRPIATQMKSDRDFHLNLGILNEEFVEFSQSLNVENIQLGISLSNNVMFDFHQIERGLNTDFNEVLKNALRRFIQSLPLRPLHFNAMLNIIIMTREAVSQSA